MNQIYVCSFAVSVQEKTLYISCILYIYLYTESVKQFILEEIKDYNEDLVKAACDILSEVHNFIDDSVLHGTN